MNTPSRHATSFAFASVALLALLTGVVVPGIAQPTAELRVASGPEDPWLVFEPARAGSKAGSGKHIVLVSGDEEYRSEEALPMLARLLTAHYGFRTTVLFAIDEETGHIDPDQQHNIPGLEALGDAHGLVLFTRFRELPDGQMKHLVDYLQAGGPVVALRTATHAFFYRTRPDSPYAHWGWRSEEWPGGFGQQVLGDTWIAHHGKHGSESTRGEPAPEALDHPILRGVSDVWGPTDVYRLANLPTGARVLLLGRILAGMTPDSPVVTDERNDPLMPVAWVRRHRWPSGGESRVFTTTMGAATDLVNKGTRRLVLNAVLWSIGLEAAVDPDGPIEPLVPYEPTDFGFGDAVKGRRPWDYRGTP